MKKLRPFAPSLLLALAACTSSPLAPIPEPLPEALSWAAGEAGGGAFLGLRTRENDSGSLDALFFRPGVRVTEVLESSPAAAAGFRVGDVVRAFAGHEVNDPAALDNLLEATAAGPEPVEVLVQRDDSVFAVPVVLRRAGVDVEGTARLVHRLDPARSRAAWRTGRGGAVLVSSDDDAPFPRAGVPVGSVVTAVDGREVLSARALLRELQVRAPGDEVDVTFSDSAGASRTAAVTLQEQPTRMTGLSIPILLGYHADAEGESTSFVLLDLWLLSLFRYEREGHEQEWRILRFLRFSRGVGELAE